MKSSRRRGSSARWWLLVVAPLLAAACDVGASSSHATGSGGGGATSPGSSSSGGGGSSSTGGNGTSTTSSSGATVSSSSSSTSSSGGTHPMAPNGYYVQGNTVYDASNKAHLFHGVARPSLEWNPVGEHISLADFQAMKGWKANVVRLAINQDFWLQGAAKYSAGYQGAVDQAIQWAHQAGLDVILDLHWSDRGDLGNQGPGQQRMADANSITFWSQVAAKYKGDGRVIFELYNEPHDVGWDVWLNGGASGDGFTAAGMQQLYDAVREAGADNLVVAGGLDWAYDLTGVPAHRIQGYNIAYATHPYKQGPEKDPTQWATYWGSLAATDPVIVTEFGTTDCSTSYYSQLVAFADQHNASWTAWAWYPGGCGFPAIINDWTGAPNAPGQILKSQLQSYPP